MQITQRTNTFLLRLIPQTSNYFRFSARWFTCSVLMLPEEKKNKNNNDVVVVATNYLKNIRCYELFSDD